ncbi:MAG: ABC transporter permease [Methylomicrobium sp.]|nr:ABC transporter permease [Methylomicrobium sp.]
MTRFNLALRLLFRDSRSGELTILIAALIIAVTSSTAITLFADRLHRTMTLQAADFLAADLVITSAERIPGAWLEKAGELALTRSETAEFSSVLMENDELLLAGVKAVSPRYPLRGFLKVTGADFSDEQTMASGPEPGSVWVEKRVLSALHLQIGDALTVGEKALTISRVLTYEPDKRGDFYSLSPRVMMHADDLPATGVIQPGSHVHYFFQFAGEAQSIMAFNGWIKPQLNPSQRIMDIHQDRPEVGNALNRAERYLGLSSIVVILIAGVAIAAATRRYSERHFDTTAVLRCLGLKQKEILWLYGSQFFILGMLASAIGCLLGWFAQAGLFHLLHDLLPDTIASPSWFAVFFGFATGMAVLLGFALPPLLRLKRVSPLRVLRRDLEPLPSAAWLVYSLAIAIIAVLIWRYTEDFKMTGIIIGVGLIALLVLGSAVYGILWACQKLLPGLPLTWRFGVQGLIRNRQASVSQILAFSITLVAMTLSFTVRNDLLTDWQRQLPEQAPNHFVLNIFPEQQAGFQQDLDGQGLTGSRFYPIVRGRLVRINGTPVQKIVSKDSQGEQATHRDLSLTWSEEVPDENKILSGRWWTDDSPGLVSIEQQLASSLGVELGDKLTFTIGSEQLQAEVVSIRSVRWDTMKPNFYMVFSPGTLDGFASTSMTSFYLPEDQKHFLNELVKRYPSVTVLEVDLILKQFQTILAQLTQAINYLLYFALLAGFTVLFAAVQAGLDQRIHEGALLRTLGAHRQFLRKTHIIEFALLGFSAGILAIGLSEIVLFALYTEVLHLHYQPNFLLWLVMPTLSGFFIGLAGFWGVRHVVDKPPVSVLREL